MLEKYVDYVLMCSGCAYCLPMCSSFDRFKLEPYGARGLMTIARLILEGKLDLTIIPPDIIYTCPNCGYCDTRCRGENTDVLEALRADLVKKGKGLPKHIGFGEWAEKGHNPYYEPHEERFAWLPKIERKIPKKAECIYFAGCTSAYRIQSIAKATVNVLNTAGVDFITLGEEEWCCGSPLLRTGQRYLAEELAKHNLEAIERTGVESVVMSCAGCYRVFKRDYPKLGLKPDFEVLHTTELFRELLSEGRLKPKKKIEMKITYHDPCHLGRHGGVYEPPRDVIKNISGLELLEMTWIKEETRCCGAGGGVKSGYPNLALEWAQARVADAELTGAQAIVSACPFCQRNLSDAIETYGLTPSKVYDISELLAQVV